MVLLADGDEVVRSTPRRRGLGKIEWYGRGAREGPHQIVAKPDEYEYFKSLGEYTLGYDYSDAPDSFSWDLIEGDVKELSGSYGFDEFEDVTEVTYETAIDPGFPVPGFLKRQAERQIVKGARGVRWRVQAWNPWLHVFFRLLDAL